MLVEDPNDKTKQLSETVLYVELEDAAEFMGVDLQELRNLGTKEALSLVSSKFADMAKDKHVDKKKGQKGHDEFFDFKALTLSKKALSDYIHSISNPKHGGRSKQYIKFGGIRYLVRSNNKIKYIISKETKISLSSIRGKYRYC